MNLFKKIYFIRYLSSGSSVEYASHGYDVSRYRETVKTLTAQGIPFETGSKMVLKSHKLPR